jgi:hypothetical protein
VCVHLSSFNIERSEQRVDSARRTWQRGTVKRVEGHPAIRRLPMNDFTDNLAVKFYLNQGASGERDSTGAASIGGLLAGGGG